MSLVTLQIFGTFLWISVVSFGGVFGMLPELERIVVGKYHWITHDQFIQSYVVSQFLPGPNMAMCPLIGYWVNGWPGFIAGFAGIYFPSIVLMGVTCALYQRYRRLQYVRRFELALRPVVVGLLTGSALRMLWFQSVGVGHSVWVEKSAGILLMAFGIAASLSKRISALTIIILSGFLWVAADWLLR